MRENEKDIKKKVEKNLINWRIYAL